MYRIPDEDGKSRWLNPAHVELVEFFKAGPDYVVHLLTGRAHIYEYKFKDALEATEFLKTWLGLTEKE